MKARLVPARVHRLSLFREPSFDLLLDHLIERRFSLDDRYTEISRLVPQLQKFHWRAATPILTHAAGRRGKVTGHDVIHVGIHHLVTHRFGAELRGRPRLTLLGEALASSANLYFALEYHRRHGPSHPFTERALRMFRRGGRRFVRLFNALLADPFRAYKRAVLEMFELVTLLFASAQRPDPFAFTLDPRLERRVARFQLYPFIEPYDYANFILYTLAFCGPASNRADAAAERACLTALERASTMKELLAWLRDARWPPVGAAR